MHQPLQKVPILKSKNVIFKVPYKIIQCGSVEPQPKDKFSATQHRSPVLVVSEVLYKIRLEYYKHFHSEICLIEVFVC
jgi:hypothetical protein